MAETKRLTAIRVLDQWHIREGLSGADLAVQPSLRLAAQQARRQLRNAGEVASTDDVRLIPYIDEEPLQALIVAAQEYRRFEDHKAAARRFRDELIAHLNAAGLNRSDIAEVINLTPTRIAQIVAATPIPAHNPEMPAPQMTSIPSWARFDHEIDLHSSIWIFIEEVCGSDPEGILMHQIYRHIASGRPFPETLVALKTLTDEDVERDFETIRSTVYHHALRLINKYALEPYLTIPGLSEEDPEYFSVQEAEAEDNFGLVLAELELTLPVEWALCELLSDVYIVPSVLGRADFDRTIELLDLDGFLERAANKVRPLLRERGKARIAAQEQSQNHGGSPEGIPPA